MTEVALGWVGRAILAERAEIGALYKPQRLSLACSKNRLRNLNQTYCVTADVVLLSRVFGFESALAILAEIRTFL